jgi:glycerate kinase
VVKPRSLNTNKIQNYKLMKIVIAPDSFKDALSSRKVAEAICNGIHAASPQDEAVVFPLADGGEGTADILGEYMRATKIFVRVEDALGRPCEAFYYYSKENHTAVVEMAQASGLQRLAFDERDCLKTSSYGTGQLMREAIDRGAKKIILTIGGSATNDAGMGMATALGIRFFDDKDRLLKGSGSELLRVKRYDKRGMEWPDEVSVEVLCDVDNPLFGPQGAAYVYAPQKGADPQAVETLDKGLRHFAKVIAHQEKTDFAEIPGAGAAGGLGFGTLAFCGARLFKGIDFVLEYTHFAQQLTNADYIITGEGKIDQQTTRGKLISGIMKYALCSQVPVIAFCGTLDANLQDIRNLGLQAVFSIQSQPTALQEALRHTSRNLELTAYNVRRLLEK